VSETPARKVPGEAGIWVVIFGDLALFSLFFLTYADYYRHDPALFHAGQAMLDRGIGIANTLLLLTSSLFVALATRALGRPHRARRLFLGGMLCGLGFAVLKIIEWRAKLALGLGLSSSPFAIFYFMLTGIHFAHLCIGLAVLALVRAKAGRIAAPRDIALIESGALFWHLVDLLWVYLFALLYLVRP
jgi:nitric oxide reductase NorE protein